jgi:hypothetical protein
LAHTEFLRSFAETLIKLRLTGKAGWPASVISPNHFLFPHRCDGLLVHWVVICASSRIQRGRDRDRSSSCHLPRAAGHSRRPHNPHHGSDLDGHIRRDACLHSSMLHPPVAPLPSVDTHTAH